MTLNLGCGTDALDGAVNVDIARLPSVDVVCDLNERPWPLPAGRFDVVRAVDVVEHLDDPVAFMEECWRVGSEGCLLTIQTVEGGSYNHYTDPTHKHGFTLESFDYFDPRTYYGSKFKHYCRGKWHIEHKSAGGGNITIVARKVGI